MALKRALQFLIPALVMSQDTDFGGARTSNIRHGKNIWLRYLLSFILISLEYFDKIIPALISHVTRMLKRM
jgi:hypothetical protein